MAFALRQSLFALDPERAHSLTLALLSGWQRIGTPLAPSAGSSPRLATALAGIRFANPLGLAAGADKDGRAIDAWHALGFGHAEIGTLTPLPQSGNARPRLFRLVVDRGVINRMGFNNGGLDAALPRLRAARRRGVVGLNVGANKDAADRVADYVHGVTIAATVADYVTINVSSPNTPGLRDLQHGAALRDLLAATTAARGSTPLFLKVAPDLTNDQIDDIAQAAIDSGIDALIVGNTTISRPPLASSMAGESGGLSGAPLAGIAAARLADFRRATGGALPLIAAGGIASADDAYARLQAGASLVQLYTALVYEGPGLAARIVAGLNRLLARDGVANVAEVVGIDAA